MPVIINDVELTTAPLPQTTAQPAEAVATTKPAEFELLQTLNLIAERQARLDID